MEKVIKQEKEEKQFKTSHLSCSSLCFANV
jgi:hypothetical protein